MTTPLSISIFKSLMHLTGFINRILPPVGHSPLPDLILCYHDVGRDGWEFTVSPREFARQIKFLRKQFSVVSLGELLSAQSPAVLPQVAITFDDGYQGVYRYAFPILKKHHLSAAVFIISKAGLNPKNPRPGKLMGISQINRLISSNWEIGYHSHSHFDLTRLDAGTLTRELTTGRIRLENRLGRKFAYFAFPYGSYDRRTLDAASKSGLPYLFSVDGGPAFTPRTPYLFHRVTISRFLTPELFTTLLTPRGITVNRIFTWALRVKDRLFPRFFV